MFVAYILMRNVRVEEDLGFSVNRRATVTPAHARLSDCMNAQICE